MKVIEFLEVCPPDHDITIYVTDINEEFFMVHRTDYFALGICCEKVMQSEIAFVHADDLKRFYITTIE